MMIDEAFARTPEPPYYAVIFTSTRHDGDEGYDAAARRMFELAVRQDGFLGVGSARDESGLGAWAVEMFEAKSRLREDGFSAVRRSMAVSMGQETTEIRTAQAALQPGRCLPPTLLLRLAAALLALCCSACTGLSTLQRDQAAQVAVQARAQHVDCEAPDACARPSPLLERGARAHAESAPGRRATTRCCSNTARTRCWPGST